MKADSVFETADTLTIPFRTSAGGIWVMLIHEHEDGGLSHALHQLADLSGLFPDGDGEEIEPAPKAKLKLVRPEGEPA